MLPCDMEELRDTLNRYVELEKDNEKYLKQAIKDARTISGLRSRVGKLMDELREKHLAASRR